MLKKADAGEYKMFGEFWLDHEVREAAFGEYPGVGSDAPQSHDYLHAAQGL